ncbi:MAG: hypothetical protein HRU46_19015 [Verrucomicrobiales bacterium]|nr:hypothetical protein [Verrucomicrobiales bacterium]
MAKLSQYPLAATEFFRRFIEENSDFVTFSVLGLIAGVSLTFWLLRAGRELGRVDKLAIGGFWTVLLAVNVGGYFLVDQAGKREMARLQDQISGFAPTYAEELGAMGHGSITVDTPPDDQVYLAMIHKQIRWLELNPSIADIYTFRKHPDGNQLIVDSETDYDRNGAFEGDREQRTEIGEIWDEFNEHFMRAFSGESAFDDIPNTDRWGTWVSAYVPMFDESDQVEAVLGVDFPAEEWVASMKRARLTVMGLLALLAVLALAAGVIIAVLRAHLNERQRSEWNLRQAKRATDAANDALAASNRDLEQFAYVASHDLQEPLRMVTSFLQLLQKRYEGKLDEKADEYIFQAVDGAERMRGLIRGLLELARVNRDIEKPVVVDVNQVVKEALKNLAVVIEENDAKVTRSTLPEVMGNESQLTQLFQNLISNAIKFCQDGNPEIDISAREVGQGDEFWWVFSVRDNGPGIPEEHHQRIYQIFQRLDSSRGDIKGTGIGLALCRRIVELHGGEITVDSAPGTGSVFKFNLPGVPK